MSGNGFAPEYVEVADRITEFYKRWPEGRIHTEIVELAENRVTVRAAVYRKIDDANPAGTGYSYLAIPGKTPYTRDSEIENAETSAVGRAIVNAGIPSKKVASADEIRAKASPAPTAAPKAPSAQPAAPAAHGGWTEGQVHEDGHKPLRARQNGSLFCPTKLPNGSWCPWKHDPAAPQAEAPKPSPTASSEPPMMSDEDLSELPF